MNHSITLASAAKIITASLLLTACGGSGNGGSPPPVAVAPTPAPTPTPTPTPPPSAGVAERDLLPTAANATLTDHLSAHFVVRPDIASARGRLFVMLPGTTAVPRFYREIVRTGGQRGYHAIGLTYPNTDTVQSYCTTSPDPDCTGKTRAEIIRGTDTSPVVAIRLENSISGRLVDLLRYLHATYPAEGWNQFLRGSEPDWSRIVLAGHSQGAGHAGYAAKLFSMVRVAMFSGPADTGLTVNDPAPWLAQANVTSADRQYGFTHVSDPLVPLAFVVSNWGRQGLDAFGAAVSVDGAAPPYSGSRRLTTAIAPNPNPPAPVDTPAHASTVVDAVVPVDASGALRYRSVWIHMAFPD